MKKRLNFITFLIGVSVGISVMNSDVFSSFKESLAQSKVDYNMIQSDDLEDEPINIDVKVNELVHLVLEPTESFTMPDKLLNKKNGEMLPARINNAVVKVPIEIGERSISSVICIILCSILILTGFIMAVYNFLRIIFAVNKSVIFEWINVRRLRRMGIGFISIFVFNTIMILVHKHTVLQLIEIENYKIINSPLEGSILMFGVVSFLVAEIFAVGLKLREEQELTI